MRIRAAWRRLWHFHVQPQRQPTQAQTRSRPWPGRKLARATGLRLLGFASWIPVLAWLHVHVAELTRIEGGSMTPLLNADGDATLTRDWVLNWKWKVEEGLERGMVVLLRSPKNPDAIVVKRIKGVAGDVVETRPPYPVEKVRVPQGHVWVEGDAPAQSSLDSNTYGPVSKRLITGKATHIVYPWRKLGPVRWREHKQQPPAAG